MDKQCCSSLRRNQWSLTSLQQPVFPPTGKEKVQEHLLKTNDICSLPSPFYKNQKSPDEKNLKRIQ